MPFVAKPAIMSALKESTGAVDMSLFQGLSDGKIMIFSAAVFNAVQPETMGGSGSAGGVLLSSLSTLFLQPVKKTVTIKANIESIMDFIGLVIVR
jgi:hypothetical protein